MAFFFFPPKVNLYILKKTWKIVLSNEVPLENIVFIWYSLVS